MEFLNKEAEKLLQECLNHSSNFPAILAEKFEGLSVAEDNLLRSNIKLLCDNGYFSKLLWADNVPYVGRIEQKGYSYFLEKNIYIRAKLRQDPYFTLLDEESEKVLLGLSQSSEAHSLVCGDASQGRVLEHLNRYGYIQFGPKGLSYTFGDNFTGVAFVTQKGKNYFSDKENRIEEILILGNDAFVVNNISKQYNLSGNSINNSPFQVGDGNTQTIDYSECANNLSELKDQIASLKLADEQIEVLNDLIATAENGCKEKDGSLVKKALKEIWDFTKQTGSNFLAAFLTVKFGLGA